METPHHNMLQKTGTLIPRTMGADRYLFRREILHIRRSCNGNGLSEKLKKKLFHLEKRIQASVRKMALRKQNLSPVLRAIEAYDAALPILAKKTEIIGAIAKNRVVIISGETGSGKTTQIPKFCLAAGRGIEGRIGCTQPRRIAATTVARRIAEELGESLGQSVGYKIRFKDQTREDAYIKVMTDGILLAETQGDPWLNEYDTLIVDEAHERSLNIDFVLGILRALLRKRKNLKLIITSATIDTEKFSKAFDNAPIIEVSGRMYPVEERYVSPGQKEGEDQNHVEMAVHAIHKLHRETRYGDILTFMPTEQDIRETCELLEGRELVGATILPLYARLSSAEQSRVFSHIPGRKIIVATNVAETSITIPGIKYVVDTGLARISQYTPKSRTTSLPVLPISKSSADQRKGRCGRVENGVCIRLFSEEDFQDRPLFTPPEILRSNLAEVIMRMIALNLGDVSDFPFIDPPAARSIKDGFDLLQELGAITRRPARRKSENGNRFRLTEQGRLMAKMPIDPRLSRMLIEAQTEGCVGEMAIIASALSLQDPRERPVEKEAQADQMHHKFKDPESDFITLLNIWNAYHTHWKKVKTNNKMKKFCKEHFLSHRRMREWRDIHSQIRAILRENGIQPQDADAESQISDSGRVSIHKSVLSGFLSNIAIKKEKYIFKGAKDKEMMIFPGSGLFKKPGDWIVAAELVETSRLFARIVASIDVSWLEALGKDQCKSVCLHPHWERNRGEVMALEQVSLYGLIIIPKRSISYGKIAPDEANQIFIQSALVEGDVKRPFPFMRHNATCIAEIRDMESRVRRRDILISEQDIYQFYAEKLPGIYDIRSLQAFLKRKGGDRFLRMKKADILRYAPDKDELVLYPDCVRLNGRQFDCTYNFDPGKQSDGVTIRVPSALAPSLPSDLLDWTVPGLLSEKITALIKGLPKTYRRQLVPVSDTVELIVREMNQTAFGVQIQESGKRKQKHVVFNIPDSALITSLANFIHQHFGMNVPASAWPLDELPDHLRMRIAITDSGGKELRSGRDKTILRGNAEVEIDPKVFKAAAEKWERNHITAWDFGELPESVTLKGKNGRTWVAYPALESQSDEVRLRLFRKRGEAIAAHTKGVEKLFMTHFSSDIKFLKKTLSLPADVGKAASYFGGSKVFVKRLYDHLLHHFFCKNIRTEKAFYFHAESVSQTILPIGRKTLEQAAVVIRVFHGSRSLLHDLEKASITSPRTADFINGLRESLSRLVPENFVSLYDTDRLPHVERYMKAITIRAQRAMSDFEKDQIKAREVKVYGDALNDLLKQLSPSASEEKRVATEDFFWLIEEYKVSLFAQELRTAVRVSPKRLDKKLKEIERMV